MKFKLRRIDWYIIKQFLGTYVFAIILIISISVVFDINEKIDKFLKPDVPLQAIILDYYMNFIPYFARPVTVRCSRLLRLSSSPPSWQTIRRLLRCLPAA